VEFNSSDRGSNSTGSYLFGKLFGFHCFRLSRSDRISSELFNSNHHLDGRETK